jgi:hypothetical protein
MAEWRHLHPEAFWAMKKAVRREKRAAIFFSYNVV